TFIVTAYDLYGNIAIGYRGAVHFNSTDGTANLPANYTFKASDNGAHTFTATFNAVGTQSLTATDTITPSIAGTQSGIQVTSQVLDDLFAAESLISYELDDMLAVSLPDYPMQELAFEQAVPSRTEQKNDSIMGSCVLPSSEHSDERVSLIA